MVFQFSCIITIRLIMFSSAAIISMIGGFYTARPCAQINFLFGRDYTLQLYPGCLPYYQGKNPDQEVVVTANFDSTTNPMEIGAALGVSFGAAGWLAFWIHAIAIEVYVSCSGSTFDVIIAHDCLQLRLTPAEAERLRQVSYERQLARG